MIRFNCKCGRNDARRNPRQTRLDALMWRFGWYPWECYFCRTVFYRTTRRSPNSSQTVPSLVEQASSSRPTDPQA